MAAVHDPEKPLSEYRGPVAGRDPLPVEPQPPPPWEWWQMGEAAYSAAVMGGLLTVRVGLTEQGWGTSLHGRNRAVRLHCCHETAEAAMDAAPQLVRAWLAGEMGVG